MHLIFSRHLPYETCPALQFTKMFRNDFRSVCSQFVHRNLNNLITYLKYTLLRSMPYNAFQRKYGAYMKKRKTRSQVRSFSQMFTPTVTVATEKKTFLFSQYLSLTGKLYFRFLNPNKLNNKIIVQYFFVDFQSY